MSDLFLVNAKYFDDYGPMKKAAGTYFPLGLGYIASYVKKCGYTVSFCDPNVTNENIKDIIGHIKKQTPALIGVSFMTPQFEYVKKLSDQIKKEYPEIPIVLGGAHPSVLPYETLKRIKAADYVVFGEGEKTTEELIRYIKDNKMQVKLENILGLAWRNKTNIVINENRPIIENLDELPFPDRSLIDQKLYQSQSFLSYSIRAASIYTSRGCPGRCVFCCSGHRLKRPLKERSMGNILDEIEELISKYNINYLLIKDDTFTAKRDRVLEFCDTIKRNFPMLKWHCMGRINTVDEKLLRIMKEAGLHDIFFGIESGVDEILKNACKGITVKAVRKAVNAASRVGVSSYGAFILGLPGETRQSIGETIKFACSLPLTMAGFSILIPYPGTKVFETHFKKSTDKIDYSKFIASTGIHYVKAYTGLKGIELNELPGFINIAQKKFYYRPAQISRMLRSASISKFYGYIRGAFALFAKQIYLKKLEQRK